MLSRVLSSPIHDLIVAMQSFEKSGEGFSYEPVTGVREVENLSASFDHMVKKIQKLMATVRSEEVNLRKTELKALQAQINPPLPLQYAGFHFVDVRAGEERGSRGDGQRAGAAVPHQHQ